MTRFIKQIAVIFLFSLFCFSCRSEPLPQPPANVPVAVSFAYPAGTSGTGFKFDYLLPAFTNNWQASTNWTTFLLATVVPTQTNYNFSSTLPLTAAGGLVTGWATNASLASPPATPVTFTPDPILTTPPSLSVH